MFLTGCCTSSVPKYLSCRGSSNFGEIIPASVLSSVVLLPFRRLLKSCIVQLLAYFDLLLAGLC